MNFLIDLFVENGNNRWQIYVGNYHAIINKNGNRRDETNDESNTKKSVELPWIPVIWPKMRKYLNKIGCKVEFQPAANRKSILCNKKSKLLPNSYPVVYQLGSNFAGHYINKTRKFVLSSYRENQQSSMAGQRESSGATEQ